MPEAKVLILGASGMLGAAVFQAFEQSEAFETIGTLRDKTALNFLPATKVGRLVFLDVLEDDEMISLLYRERPNFVINCVGLIKQIASAADPLVALPLNALFPHRLARLCALTDARLIHISTDCVFSGSKGNYTEEDEADAGDLYGRSKLLGEVVNYKNAVTLRTSIIGRELYTQRSLLEWFLSQERTAPGYSRAIFSGLPTCELGAVIRLIVSSQSELTGLYHVSAKPISKFELLHLLRRQYEKKIEIVEDGRVQIDRSLNSERFTAATGYRAPEWPELVRRLYESDTRRKRSHV